MSGPLEGIRVLDFGMAAVGPVSATYLGLLGADVIKVEQPGGDIVRRGANTTIGGMGFTFIGNNYTKRSIVLNLKDAGDREIALKLIAMADVVMDNFRSRDIMPRLGLTYELMSGVNPRIIYLQASAWGSGGPLEGMLSHEWFTEAAGGHASLIGTPGGKPQFTRGTAYLDWNGAMINALGILIALYAREKTGRGLMMETSQFQSTITAGITRWAEYLTTGEAPGPMGSARPNIVPDQAFPTAYGYVSITALHNGHWARLCQALGAPELAADPRFVSNANRVQNRDVLLPLIEKKLAKKAAWQWLKVLREHGVPCGEYFEGRPRTHVVREHPQTEANGMMATLETPWGPINASTGQWKFSRTPTRISRPAPKLDEHRAEILAELGRNNPQISQMTQIGEREGSALRQSSGQPLSPERGKRAGYEGTARRAPTSPSRERGGRD